MRLTYCLLMELWTTEAILKSHIVTWHISPLQEEKEKRSAEFNQKLVFHAELDVFYSS